MKNSRTAGFTLLELSIVLVIIGLIIGGILVGQDLIRAAEVRSTVGQVEKYNSAVNTFRTKFDGIPGDMTQASASYFDLFTMTATPVGMGDGNGLLEGGAAGATDPIGETLVFWRHLSDANLVDGSLGTVSNSLIVPSTGLVTATVTTPSQSLPPSKLSGQSLFIVYSVSGSNYFQLMPVSTITTGPAYTFSTTGITPIQAFNMDTKLDDGQPNTGIVIARDTGSTNGVNGLPSTAATSTPATCEVGATATDTTNTYNRALTTGGTDTSCSVRFRFN